MLTTQQKLDRAVTSLMRDSRTAWLSGILVMGKRTLCAEKTETAATDGVNEWYNPSYVDELSTAHLQTLVLHESLHKAFKHLHVWQDLWKEDARAANHAMDYVINLVIVDELKFTLPEDALYDTQYRGMDTKQVYTLLRSNPPPPNQAPQDYHDWDNAQRMPEEQVERAKKAVDTAMRHGAIVAKHMGNAQGDLERWGLLQTPKLDWRSLLAEFLTAASQQRDDTTWRRPSRRGLALGLYLPSATSASLGSIVVAVDTSGSVSDQELGAMLSEVQSLCLGLCPQRVLLLYWDAKIEKEEVYGPGSYDQLAQSTRAVGGGGTDAHCVAQYLEQHKVDHDVLIVLTDGILPSFPTFEKPTAWVITTSNITAPTGRTITLGV